MAIHDNEAYRRFAAYDDRKAFVCRGETLTYADFAKKIEDYSGQIRQAGVKAGAVVAVEGGYSPDVIAMLFALMDNKNIVVPISTESKEDIKYDEDGFINWYFTEGEDGYTYEFLQEGTDVGLIADLRRDQSPGLVLFSSGSTGKSKAILHDLNRLIEKFLRTNKKTGRSTIGFLQFDHIGGLNTIFYVLTTGGCLVIPDKNAPEEVCRCIQEHRVNLLPTTPSFLNLLLLSGAYKKYDLSSLRFISYGTEAMPDSTLKRLKAEFPRMRFIQTYGLSEVGILNPQAAPDNPQWFKLDPAEVDHKIVDGQLWLRAKTNMVGYLNAPNSTEDGWFNTEDAVEQKGDYIRIIGRTSEIINVGGNKVYPQEIEDAVLEVDAVEDVLVSKESNPILGQIAVAYVVVKEECKGLDPAKIRSAVRSHCKSRLEPFKVPAKVEVVEGSLVSFRFKKKRT